MGMRRNMTRGIMATSLRDGFGKILLLGSYGWTVVYLSWSALEVIAHTGRKADFFAVLYWVLAMLFAIRWSIQTTSRLARLGWSKVWLLTLAAPWIALFSFAAHPMSAALWIAATAVVIIQTWFLYRLHESRDVGASS
jgi:hypothetical protein